MKWYMYILRCADKSYYVGSTDNIARRYKEHAQGRGAKWTRTRLPVELVYLQAHQTREAALKQEQEVKGWSREKKLQLIETYQSVERQGAL